MVSSTPPPHGHNERYFGSMQRETLFYKSRDYEHSKEGYVLDVTLSKPGGINVIYLHVYIVK